jgi:hypothetical protein
VEHLGSTDSISVAEKVDEIVNFLNMMQERFEKAGILLQDLMEDEPTR